MAVEIFTGTPGSGKSLHACNVIRTALNSGRYVIANFPLSPSAPVDFERYCHVENSLLTPELVTSLVSDWWEDHDFHEGGVYLVIDECQLLFNSRTWATRSRMPWLELMSQSRKWGLHVLLVAQGVKMVDTQFRMLVDTEVKHFSLSSFGNVGWLASLLCGGRLFLVREVQYQTGAALGTYLFRGSRRDCDMYDTHALFARLDN